MSDGHVQFTFNNPPKIRGQNEQYKHTIAWNIQFAPGVFNTLGPVLSQLRAMPSTTAPVATMPADERSVLYYNLRSALIEQPIPKRLGALGHWQNRLPGGTPQHLPYMEDRYRAKTLELQELAQQEEADRKDGLKKAAVANQTLRDIIDLRRDNPQAPWVDENAVLRSDGSLPALEEMDIQTTHLHIAQEADKHAQNSEAVFTAFGKQPEQKTGLLSPPVSDEGNPSGKQRTPTGKQSGNSVGHHSLGSPVNDRRGVDLFAYSTNQSDHSNGRSMPFPPVSTYHWAQSPSVGSPPSGLAFRGGKGFSDERKVSMKAVAFFQDGRQTPIEVVIPEGTIR